MKNPKKMKQVFVFMGLNDCMAMDFDKIEVTGSYKDLIYTWTHKPKAEVTYVWLLIVLTRTHNFLAELKSDCL